MPPRAKPLPANLEMLPVADLKPHPQNPKRHPDSQVDGLAGAEEEFGFLSALVVDENNTMIAGEGRWLMAQKRGLSHVPGFRVTGWTEEKKIAFMVSDNRWPMLGEFDDQRLRAVLEELKLAEYDYRLIGYDDAAFAQIVEPLALSDGNGSLAAQFGIPPFSVFNAREGWWQARKDAWISLGIQSELGRGAEPGGSKQPTINPATGKICRADSKGRPIKGTDAGTQRKPPPPPKGYARTFGQDLMKGEHVLGTSTKT